MSLALGGTGLTDWELERLRLLLSVFQDGTGMIVRKDRLLHRPTKKKAKNGLYISEEFIQSELSILEDASPEYVVKEAGQRTLPGWRDFERVVALALDGIALESKSIVDVIVPLPSGGYYGLSCKSRDALNQALSDNGDVYIEVSNASGRFWDHLGAIGINQTNYHEDDRAQAAGNELIKVVSSWHTNIPISSYGQVYSSRSSYLVLLYNQQGQYQLYQFPLTVPRSEALSWSVPLVRGSVETGTPRRRRCLVAKDDSGRRVVEWYLKSGGQLKYYPLVSDAVWVSPIFTLEPLPPGTKHGVISKVEDYFSDKWRDVVSKEKAFKKKP